MILKDRVAIVTGAGSGIGRASAEIMAREGAFVMVSDLRGEAADEVAGGDPGRRGRGAFHGGRCHGRRPARAPGGGHG